MKESFRRFGRIFLSYSVKIISLLLDTVGKQGCYILRNKQPEQHPQPFPQHRCTLGDGRLPFPIRFDLFLAVFRHPVFIPERTAIAAKATGDAELMSLADAALCQLAIAGVLLAGAFLTTGAIQRLFVGAGLTALSAIG